MRREHRAAEDVTDPVTAYDFLATEYDDPEHETTRELERLSAIAWEQASAFSSVARARRVLELGCGTGALTEILGAHLDGACIVATDPSGAMLARAERRVARFTKASLVLCRASAAEALDRIHMRPELIACGLSDPFMSRDLVRRMVRRCGPNKRVFVTLPSRRWAIPERRDRLHVDLEQTKFRMRDAKIVTTRSLALDEQELANYFRASGYRAIAGGTVRSAWSTEVPPEVSWVLASPIVAEVAPLVRDDA